MPKNHSQNDSQPFGVNCFLALEPWEMCYWILQAMRCRLLQTQFLSLLTLFFTISDHAIRSCRLRGVTGGRRPFACDIRIFSKLRFGPYSFICRLSVPILPIVAAISALVAVGVLLWQNWETISQKAQEIWGAIWTYLQPVVQPYVILLCKNLKKYVVGGWKFGRN